MLECQRRDKHRHGEADATQDADGKDLSEVHSLRQLGDMPVFTASQLMVKIPSGLPTKSPV